MTFKCTECGHIFDDGEQAVLEERHGLDTPPYEQFSGCPLCHGDYEETKPCKHCGSEKLDDELYEGWCEECLCEQITYDTFLDYCESNVEEHYLDIFVMRRLLGGMECPDWISYEFHQLMIEIYTSRVSDTKYFARSGFISDCINFIMKEDGSTGKENFANWLNRKEVK